MIRSGWARVPEAGEAWHAFVVTEERVGELVAAQCCKVRIPAAGLDVLEVVPRGRPCFPCLMAVTEELPHVGRMGSAS